MANHLIGEYKKRVSKHECPSCGRDGKLYITKATHARALVACVPCSMAENENGDWIFYAGGITAL